MKRVAILLAGILILGIPLFAGGGRQSGASDSQDGLAVIKIWGANKQGTWGSETVKVSDFYDGSVKSRFWDKFVADLAKRGLKLDLTLIMEDQAPTAFQTLLAAGRLNDYDYISAMEQPDRTRLSLVEQGRLYPLNKAIEQYSGGEARDYYFNTPDGRHFAKIDTLEDGNFYWLSQNSFTWYQDESNIMGSPMVLQFRQDWLDKLGLPAPRTLDDVYNCLVAFQQNDVNDNGIRDECLSIDITNFGDGIPQWFGLGPGLVSSLNFKADSPWYHPNVKEYFTFLNRLYRAGLINVNTEGGGLNGNQYAGYAGYGVDYWVEPSVTVPSGVPPAHYEPLVIQALSNTPSYIVMSQWGYAQYYSAIMAVPAGSKNIANTTKLIDYLVSEDAWLLRWWGIEGYSYERQNGQLVQWTTAKDPVSKVDAAYSQLAEMWMGWYSLFPSYQKADIQVEWGMMFDLGKIAGQPANYRSQFYNDWLNGKYPAYQSDDTVLAFPTAREIERKAELGDLETYSSELSASLIMGEKNLSDWDSYIRELKRLGLDDLIRIHQARIDRGR
jgi:hypothetical protein